MHEKSRIFIMPSRGVAIFSHPLYAVASPDQKSGGPKMFHLLVSSKSYNIHTWDTAYSQTKHDVTCLTTQMFWG